MKLETRNPKPYSNQKLETRIGFFLGFLISGLIGVSGFWFGISAYAQSFQRDIGFTAEDVSFAKSPVFAGEAVKIYATVHNYGKEDMEGTVTFTIDGNVIGTPRVISLRASGKDEEAWVNWLTSEGSHVVRAVLDVEGGDGRTENNSVDTRITVERDTDKDGIPDSQDADDDNDSLPDTWEIKMGLDPINPNDALQDPDGDGLKNIEEYQKNTDPHKADTDGDGLNDKDDVDPTNPKITRDTDGDGIDDTIDSDDDNDGLYDFEEEKLGTDPRKRDTDGDGVGDREDAFPLDPRRSREATTNSTSSSSVSGGGETQNPNSKIQIPNNDQRNPKPETQSDLAPATALAEAEGEPISSHQAALNREGTDIDYSLIPFGKFAGGWRAFWGGGEKSETEIKKSEGSGLVLIPLAILLMAGGIIGISYWGRRKKTKHGSDDHH